MSESMKNIPIYRHNGSHALGHNELSEYRASLNANTACKEAIEKAIGANYDGCSLNAAAIIEAVSADFSMERIAYVLAISVRYYVWDDRISAANMQWACRIPAYPNLDSCGYDRNGYLVVQSHPGLLNLFVTAFRKAYEATI